MCAEEKASRSSVKKAGVAFTTVALDFFGHERVEDKVTVMQWYNCFNAKKNGLLQNSQCRLLSDTFHMS